MTSTYKEFICAIGRHNCPADELQRAALPVYWLIYDTTNRTVLGRYETELEAYAAHQYFMATCEGNPIIADPLHSIMEDARRAMDREVNQAVRKAKHRGHNISIFDMYPVPEVPTYDL